MEYQETSHRPNHKPKAGTQASVTEGVEKGFPVAGQSIVSRSFGGRLGVITQEGKQSVLDIVHGF